MADVALFALSAVSTGIQFPDLDPVLLEIGPFKLRWYALAYIAGLIIGWRYMVHIAKTPRLWGGKPSPFTITQADDFLFYATLGVILGGRIGYVLFYMLPDPVSRAALGAEPWKIFAIWEGGMAFHGGLIGVALAILWFSRANKIPLLSLADVVAACAPIGLFFGRLANFINAELYGRETAVPWGVMFPIKDQAGQTVDYTSPRHPSQIYEAILEGIILLLILRVATHQRLALTRPGLTAGLFLAAYGAFRALVELVREPDRQMPEALRGAVTMGMLLCVPMIVAGVWLIRNATKAAPPQAKPA